MKWEWHHVHDHTLAGAGQDLVGDDRDVGACFAGFDYKPAVVHQALVLAQQSVAVGPRI